MKSDNIPVRHNIEDVTFLILTRIDTIERVENLLLTTEFLVSNFDTKVDVLESSSYNNGIVEKLLSPKIRYNFIKDDDPILFRTKYLNRMISTSKTPFIAVWDVDVLSTVEQILEAVDILRRGEAEFVYPYASKLLDTSLIIRKLYLENRSMDFLEKNKAKMKEMYPPVAVGGAFFCKADAYADLGLENEEFYGWGVEDGERFTRWESSKYRVKRVEGVLFHLSHPRGINSLIHSQDQTYIKLRVKEASGRAAKLKRVKKNEMVFGTSNNVLWA